MPAWVFLLQLDQVHYIHIIMLPQALWVKEQHSASCLPCEAALFALMNAEECGAKA